MVIYKKESSLPFESTRDSLINAISILIGGL